MRRNGQSGREERQKSGSEDLLQLRDAALQLGISFPTIKQWIYKKKIRSIKTAGAISWWEESIRSASAA